MASAMVAQPVVARGRPLQVAPAPRTASNRSPVAWLTTTAARSAGAVDRGQAGGVPGQLAGRVGGTVDRIEGHHHVAIGVVEAGLLAQHAQSRVHQHRHRHLVGGQVAEVLAGTGARRPPVVEVGQGVVDGRRHLVEDGDEAVVGHCSNATRRSPPHRLRSSSRWPPSTLPDMSPSSRTTPSTTASTSTTSATSWRPTPSARSGRSTSTPRRAAAGPLDLHLALEVEPRVLLAFEDVVSNLPDDEDPADDFQFPLIFTWALPPLPKGPDLLLLATELAGVGGPDLPARGVGHRLVRARSPTPPSAASPSSPASRCRWPRSWPARSCCATCSTAAWP